MLLINVTGNITADAIIRTINEKTVIAFTIAHNNRFKNKKGEVRDEVTFVRCAIWDKPELAKLFYKGRGIYANGFLKHNIWYDGNGIKQASLDMSISMFKVFGKSKQAEPNHQTAATSFEHEEHSQAYVTNAIEQHEADEIITDLPF